VWLRLFSHKSENPLEKQRAFLSNTLKDNEND
jgi:hypothetical protein